MKVVEENVNIMNFLFGWSSSTTSEPADASSTRWRKKSRLKSRQQRRQSLPTAEFEPARDNLPASSSTSTTWTHQPRGRHPSVLSTTSRTSSASLSSHSTIGDSYYGRRRDNIAYDELEELRDGTSSIFPLETPFIPPRTVSVMDLANSFCPLY
ncbi:hypothetical protein BC829DRAFT_387847 [Chytridium lagenaria]|nr:hypothetical protein BC829DRAFT_387847 [Chytridium lagenaria]